MQTMAYEFGCLRPPLSGTSSTRAPVYLRKRILKNIQTYLQFVLIKQVLHLQAPISCWCLFSFAIYFIPAAPPCPLNTLPTFFSKQKINRLEVT